MGAKPERIGLAQAGSPGGTSRVRAGNFRRALRAALALSGARSPRRRGDPCPRRRILRRAWRLASRHLSSQPRGLPSCPVLGPGLRAVREAAAVPRPRPAACGSGDRKASLGGKRHPGNSPEDPLPAGRFLGRHKPRALGSRRRPGSDVLSPRGGVLRARGRVRRRGGCLPPRGLGASAGGGGAPPPPPARGRAPFFKGRGSPSLKSPPLGG